MNKFLVLLLLSSTAYAANETEPQVLNSYSTSKAASSSATDADDSKAAAAKSPYGTSPTAASPAVAPPTAVAPSASPGSASDPMSLINSWLSGMNSGANSGSSASAPVTSSWNGQLPIQPFTGDTLTCTRSGQNECSQENLKLQDIPPSYFSSISNGLDRQKKFIEWMQPMALYIQAKTGMPASVIIAQAAIETGYGTSYQFKNSNALFGHSCWKPGTQVTGSVNLNGTSREYVGYCGAKRPANEGGYYLVFRNREESVLAYISNLLNSGLYKQLDRTVAAAQSSVPPVVASCTSVIQCLGGYAAGAGYEQKLTNIIGQFGLAKLDSGGCQSCLYAQNSANGSATGSASGSSQ